MRSLRAAVSGRHPACARCVPGAGGRSVQGRAAGSAERQDLDDGQDPDHDERLQPARQAHQVAPADARVVGRWPARAAGARLAHVQAQGLAARGAARPPERLERLDPRGLRPALDDVVARHRQPRRAHRDGVSRRAQAAQLPGRDRQARDAHAAAGSTRSTRSSRSPIRRASSAPGRCTSRPSRTCSSTTAAGPAASRSTVATARAWPIRSARRPRTAACAWTTRTSSGWPASSRSARPF